jgi:tRNA(fMet)-specific endonuclease VapC
MRRLSYLLDSHILSEPSRPHPNVHVQSRLLAHRHAVCTAALVLYEMYYGLALMPDGRRKQALTHYLEQAVQQRLIETWA